MKIQALPQADKPKAQAMAVESPEIIMVTEELMELIWEWL
jgi:hypothetical protein